MKSEMQILRFYLVGQNLQHVCFTSHVVNTWLFETSGGMKIKEDTSLLIAEIRVSQKRMVQ